MPEWGWVMGTGLYLDDVADALARIDAAARVDIDRMSGWVALIWGALLVVRGLRLFVFGEWIKNWRQARLQRLLRK